MFKIRPMQPDEAESVARLIHHSTNHWYEAHHHQAIFPGDPLDCLIFPQTYEALDPGHCFLAVESSSREIIGSCFHHPRESHHSLGIMNAHPNYQGVAKALLQHLITLAEADQKPLRLISSAGNLDSFSLYNRHGFTPYAIYQDMTVGVPNAGLALPNKVPLTRQATLDDLPVITALETTLAETSREKDWRHFIENKNGHWITTVTLDSDHKITGAIASIKHPATHQIGPAIAPDANTLLALIITQLNLYPGDAPLLLIPADEPSITKALYDLGARNHEIHLAQSRGPAPKQTGLVLPTFLPETS